MLMRNQMDSAGKNQAKVEAGKKGGERKAENARRKDQRLPYHHQTRYAFDEL